MRISLLQPKIRRGNIEENFQVLQRLIDKSKGELLVLPEYALTGSLVLDKNANALEWAQKCAQVEPQFNIPEGKFLMLNSLVEEKGKLFNCCRLLPTEEHYFKQFPDPTEQSAGILPGTENKVFEAAGKRFKVVICYDLPHINEISTDNLDFLLFIYHFTENNFLRVMGEIKEVSVTRKLRVLASSLVSDMNNGFSSYIDSKVVVSLSEQEGILEIEIE
jgi:predicted amidohydrolase